MGGTLTLIGSILFFPSPLAPKSVIWQEHMAYETTSIKKKQHFRTLLLLMMDSEVETRRYRGLGKSAYFPSSSLGQISGTFQRQEHNDIESRSTLPGRLSHL